jgi:hypothetical protein
MKPEVFYSHLMRKITVEYVTDNLSEKSCDKLYEWMLTLKIRQRELTQADPQFIFEKPRKRKARAV